MSVRSETPVLISYPKSGRTWLRYMSGLLDIDMVWSHAGTGLDNRAAGRSWLHYPELAADATEPPRAGRKYPAARPVALLYRDPRDTVVSYFHHCSARHSPASRLETLRLRLQGRAAPASLSAFLRHPGYGLEKCARFSMFWTRYLSTRPAGLVLTYEDLRRDTGPYMARLAALAGQPRTAERITAAVEAARFDKMRRVEEAGTSDIGAALATRRPGESARKVRRGKVGGFADELSAADLSWCTATLDRLGYWQVCPLSRDG